MISSKSIFFATSPFHSLQVTRWGQSIAPGLGEQGLTPGLGWVVGWGKFGFCAICLLSIPYSWGGKSWWEGGFHILYREVLIDYS